MGNSTDMISDAIALHLPLAVVNLANSILPAREYFANSNEGSQGELLLGRRRILKSDIHEVETGFIEETRFLHISIVVMV
ncbi:hypothetical protein [Microseira wollei]|uniref:Uncharacterized protein n=1 Tax=Microseira wollei NIES-4236 TaxID=2530354 RepID=A0AAV3X6E7_9CYAN|nr:hypothetical protein [Microseira wollei]GET36146.1 hypothetical protein MiSe_08940 [Microseira wollei NIES-4236]